MPKQKWTTVMNHRSYEIQINAFPEPQTASGFGYRVNDPAFLPDYKRFATVQDAVEAIDKATK
jgi:hypothetical protein